MVNLPKKLLLINTPKSSAAKPCKVEVGISCNTITKYSEEPVEEAKKLNSFIPIITIHDNYAANRQKTRLSISSKRSCITPKEKFIYLNIGENSLSKLKFKSEGRGIKRLFSRRVSDTNLTKNNKKIYNSFEVLNIETSLSKISMPKRHKAPKNFYLNHICSTKKLIKNPQADQLNDFLLTTVRIKKIALKHGHISRTKSH
ncbi:unnamed protein product [Blepharisma stoltei]|uniref:Ribosomal protein S10 n=1 Tax=Blepharisma stoltei TaxID=1481888 RepID=A0AAU9IG48_9CILI|nr:unnamed protein product [Blepharisma stoltei]